MTTSTLVFEENIHLDHLDQKLSFWFEQILPGQTILLQGGVGAGKTTLARAMLRCFEVSEPILSPTYAIMLSYEAKDFDVIHIDAYRLSPMVDLPWDWREYLDAVKLIEWAEHLSSAPKTDWCVSIESTELPETRKIRIDRIKH